jgi:iron complex outermembrane receptor protein
MAATQYAKDSMSDPRRGLHCRRERLAAATRRVLRSTARLGQNAHFRFVVRQIAETNMIPGFRVGVALLAAALPGLSRAEPAPPTLDPVVVTGSRVEHSSFDLPVSVDVVDATRIGADNARVNASEALAAVPGITVLNRQNYAQDLQISSRGFGARSAFGVRGIRLVSDGIPASMPDGQGQAATFNLDRAERIEVMRGPLSAIYGNSAGGVIQLFSREGGDPPTVESSVAAGSYGTWKADVAAQGRAAGIGYVFDASRFASEGYRDHSSAQRDQSLAKLTYAPDADSKLMFIANGFAQQAQDPLGTTWARYTSAPRSVEESALLYNTRKSISQMQGGVSYERRFGEDLVQLMAYAGQRAVTQYQAIPRVAQLITSSTPADDPRRRQSGGVIDFDRDFSGLSARWIGRHELGGGKLTTTLGVDYERANDDRQGYENFVGLTLGVKGALRRDEVDRATSFDQYAQAEWQLGDWLLTGGLRHSQATYKVTDNYVTNGNQDDSGTIDYDQTTPLLAVLYRLTPAVNVYASAARGFETPTLNELFYSGPGGGFSYDLKAATSNHYEIGLKAFIGNDSRLDVALFDIRTDNELAVKSSFGGRTSYQNVAQTTRRGVELAVDSRWAGDFTTRIAYSGLAARYSEPFTTLVLGVPTRVEAGNYLPGVPGHTLFGELVWRQPFSGWHAGVEALARSKIYVEDSNTQQAAPAYAIANLRAGFDQQRGALRYGAFLRLDNIFDRQYAGSVVVSDANGRYYEAAPGRNWLAGLNLRYSY